MSAMIAFLPFNGFPDDRPLPFLVGKCFYKSFKAPVQGEIVARSREAGKKAPFKPRSFKLF